MDCTHLILKYLSRSESKTPAKSVPAGKSVGVVEKNAEMMY
jgi:hypothetical protein